MAVLQEPQVHIAKSIFSSRIVCGDCGSYFGSKVRNSTSKYRRVIWQCNGKFKGEHKCETPHLDEETIKMRFVAALNAIIGSKDSILEDCRLMQTTLTDCTGMPMDVIISMGTAVNPMITDLPSLMLFSVFPFNLFKHGVTSFITYLIYKRAGNTLRGIIAVPEPKSRKVTERME